MNPYPACIVRTSYLTLGEIVSTLLSCWSLIAPDEQTRPADLADAGNNKGHGGMVMAGCLTFAPDPIQVNLLS